MVNSSRRGGGILERGIVRNKMPKNEMSVISSPFITVRVQGQVLPFKQKTGLYFA
jgi:hypothetical protein